MNDVIIELVKEEVTIDSAGDHVINETSREVFAEISSINQSEFYQAQAAGLKPEIKFLLTDYADYEGEKIVKYENQKYKVLRTYRSRKNYGIEITCYGGVEIGSA